MRTAFHIGLSLISIVAAPVAGATVAPRDPSDIIVQGERDRDKQISHFIRSLTPAPVRGQTSRFESGICPAVAGLPDGQQVNIARRIRRVAQAAGIAVEKPGCDPNLVLIVTNDKAALLKKLARQRPDYFPGWSSGRLRDLERDRYPVAAWHIETSVESDGRLMPVVTVGSSQNGVPSDAGWTTEMASRLTTVSHRAFIAAVVVVQADALAGLTTTQLADYAAMRALVRTEPTKFGQSGDSTILSIIDTPMGKPVPLTLTAWDLSFIRAFYASSRNSYVEYQRSEMQRLMKRNLDRSQSSSQ
jgi:hypothetical protein